MFILLTHFWVVAVRRRRYEHSCFEHLRTSLWGSYAFTSWVNSWERNSWVLW